MRDYTTENYCDFLWIGDLLHLKPNQKKFFPAVLKKDDTVSYISINNVIIFGTIVEIKQIGLKDYLYRIDDGTGTILCKHSESQFEEIITVVENELCNTVSSIKAGQNLEETCVTDSSMDDSIFNDNSIQKDELSFINRNLNMGFKSLWNDIYDSFTNLLGHYRLGDIVLIEGKLYNYFNSNQIYINCIRPMSLTEQIAKVSIKLQDGFNPIIKSETGAESLSTRRWSGLMTFDHIHHLNVHVPPVRNITFSNEQITLQEERSVENVPQEIDSAITFDTLNV